MIIFCLLKPALNVFRKKNCWKIFFFFANYVKIVGKMLIFLFCISKMNSEKKENNEKFPIYVYKKTPTPNVYVLFLPSSF